MIFHITGNLKTTWIFHAVVSVFFTCSVFPLQYWQCPLMSKPQKLVDEITCIPSASFFFPVCWAEFTLPALSVCPTTGDNGGCSVPGLTDPVTLPLRHMLPSVSLLHSFKVSEQWLNGHHFSFGVWKWMNGPRGPGESFNSQSEREHNEALMTIVYTCRGWCM